ncbi:MAG: cation transport regulator ChaB [Ketobacter sp.]|nr:MAG: cation transport regulator ChaB [Ketobacter sp.]
MPYQNTTDLPDQVKQHLPSHAQEIYKEAFNNAWEQYADKKDRKGDDSREATSHKVAWSAVEKSYHKNSSGNWVKN